MVFSAPFYLQNLLDEERYHGYPINDPAGFLDSLMLVSGAFEVEGNNFISLRSYSSAIKRYT